MAFAVAMKGKAAGGEEGIMMFAREKLRHAGAEATFGYKNAEALGEVVGFWCAHGEADAIFAALNAEDA